MSKWIHFNGQLVEAGTAIIPAASRGLRYGDGLFETIKVTNGNIALAAYHFDRLFTGMQLLKLTIPSFLTPAYLTEQILQLCQKNKVEKLARVRLNIFRGNGSLYTVEDPIPQIVIEAEQLLENYAQWNAKGLTVGIYMDATKSCDKFANLKSNNFLPYVMGALYAKQQQWDDCFVINTHGRVCDATIANVFWIKNDTIYTPPLTEGCVAGVMRKYLIQQLTDSGMPVTEQPLGLATLEQADEVFLTNALFGIRSVTQFRDKIYTNNQSFELYSRFI